MIMRARVTKADTTPKSYQAQLKSKAKVGYVNKLIGDVLSLWLVLTINYQSAKAKRNRRQAEGHDEAKGNVKKQSVQKKSYRSKNGPNCTAKVPVEARKNKRTPHYQSRQWGDVCICQKVEEQKHCHWQHLQLIRVQYISESRRSEIRKESGG